VTVNVYYDRHNKRLVYLGESASPEFWDALLDAEDFRKSVAGGKDDRFTLKILRKYFPDKKGRILEGGCGEGRIVYCMHTHGYESVGIDSARKTIEKTKNLFPELDVRVGDVRKLPFPDNYFAGYWSIGVIEHFREGYQAVLAEMLRVVADGGYLFLSFPYMSPIRRLKARLGSYQEYMGRDKEDFYQYALDAGIVLRDLKASGFKYIEKIPSAGLKGCKDEVFFLKPILQRLFSYKGNSLLVRGLKYMLDQWLAIFAGHTLFLVLRK
jgi:SAM-dependent methyltransferase